MVAIAVLLERSSGSALGNARDVRPAATVMKRRILEDDGGAASIHGRASRRALGRAGGQTR
jgi:hypothetical protein